MRRLVAVLAVSLATAVVATPTAAADTHAGPTYGIRAAHYGDTTLPGGQFAYRLTAGTSIRDAVSLYNYTPRPLTLDVYPADVVMAKGGGLAPAQQSAPRKEVGAWISLRASQVTLRPRSRLDVSFTMSVPRGTVPGDYVGAVVVTKPVVGTRQGITVQTRGALVTSVRVVGKADFRAVLGHLKSKRQHGTIVFSLPVRSTGNVMFTTEGFVEIRHDGHVTRRLHLTPADLYVLPDGTGTLTARWSGVPTFGSYTARAVVVARAGRLPAKTLYTERSLRFFPTRAAIAGAAMLLLLILLAAAGRRPAARWLAERRADHQAVLAARAARRGRPA